MRNRTFCGTKRASEDGGKICVPPMPGSFSNRRGNEAAASGVGLPTEVFEGCFFVQQSSRNLQQDTQHGTIQFCACQGI